MHRFVLIPAAVKTCGRRLAFFLAGMALVAFPAFSAFAAAVSAMDDSGHAVVLDAPARRIVSLAPHGTELLFAAGAGPRIVGVSEYSNFPPDAVKIASVGGAASLDLERILVLKPDLVVAWGSGNSATQIARLRALGIAVFESEPRDFETIASNMERLAHLAGTDAAGHRAASAFRQRLRLIAQTYQGRSKVSVFYQVWQTPLMTVNGKHLVSRVIELCGGSNIFRDLPQLAPTVGIESVVDANPEVIINYRNGNHDGQSGWNRFPAMTAVARNNFYSVNADLMTRAGPRIVDGAEQLCRQLEAARGKRQ